MHPKYVQAHAAELRRALDQAAGLAAELAQVADGAAARVRFA